jgi:hypothetical protein
VSRKSVRINLKASRELQAGNSVGSEKGSRPVLIDGRKLVDGPNGTNAKL